MRFLILILLLVTLLLIKDYQGYSQWPVLPPLPYPSEHEFAKIHNYHGIYYSYHDGDKWVFERDGQVCKLFKENG